MLPPFEGEILPVGLHRCDTTEFLEVFCNTEYRRTFQKSLSDVFDYCKEKGASRLIVGGSYVTRKERPSDFDCVIVFPKKDHIPAFSDSAVDGNIAFDILFASEDFPRIVENYVNLFTKTRKGEEKRGVVEIVFDNSEPWKVQHSFNEKEINVVRRSSDRKIVERKTNRGVLVSIHGVNTIAAWNALMSPIVSSQGWIFAPFVYNNPKRLLVCRKKREDVIQQFRQFIFDVHSEYKLPISVVCHSFGTYIICRYLRDVGEMGVGFDSVILTGGIIDTGYDWSNILSNDIGTAMNVYTKADRAVWWMPPRWLIILFSKLFVLDKLFGKCGINPFVQNTRGLEQKMLNILDHTHVFKKDFISLTVFL